MNATPPARARGARGARAMDPAALERLHDACEEGDIDAARALCDADRALLTARDEDGQTCLHHACAGGDVEVVRFLVDACGPGSLGCNERDDHDMTPFHLACECGHIAVVEYLASLPQLDVTLRDPARTGYFLASKHGHAEICALLDKLHREGVVGRAADDDDAGGDGGGASVSVRPLAQEESAVCVVM